MAITIRLDQITDHVRVRTIKPAGVQALAEKIRRFGYLDQYPVIVSPLNGGYQLVCGNHREQALRALGGNAVVAHVLPEGLTAEAKIRLARQDNEAAETVVKTTFADDAELVWRLAADHTQEQVGELLGWSREKVAQYGRLRQIAPTAWKAIVTTLDPVVTEDSTDPVTENVTAVTDFTENLLRAILPLRPRQQVELVRELAEGRIDKRQFNKQARNYAVRNAAKAFAYKEIRALGHRYLRGAWHEIDKGAYDRDWTDAEGHPRLTKLLESLREEWERVSGIRKWQGDFEVLVREVPNGSIDLVLTDPPYGISDEGRVTKRGGQIVQADFDGEDDWDHVSPEQMVKSLEDWTSEWARILRPGGALIVFCDLVLVGDLWRVYQGHGLSPKRILLWHKPNPSPAALARRNLPSSIEAMVWGVKPGAEYTFNPAGDWTKGQLIEAPVCAGSERIKDEKGGTLHPTQKPEALIRKLMLLASNRGDTVFDGFAGVGTTGRVAKDEGRKFLGIEQSPMYFAAMARRLEEE